jgi:hypothetical protein
VTYKDVGVGFITGFISLFQYFIIIHSLWRYCDMLQFSHFISSAFLSTSGTPHTD